jgi:hypothetical protein
VHLKIPITIFWNKAFIQVPADLDLQRLKFKAINQKTEWAENPIQE